MDGLNIDANSVSSIRLPIRTGFGNKGMVDAHPGAGYKFSI